MYIGSPAYAKPVVCWSDSFSTPVARLVSFPHSNLFILPPNAAHLIVTRTRNRTMHIVWSAVLSWSHVDDIIRIWDTKKGTRSGLKENMNFHKVQGFLSTAIYKTWENSLTEVLSMFVKSSSCYSTGETRDQ